MLVTLVNSQDVTPLHFSLQVTCLFSILHLNFCCFLKNRVQAIINRKTALQTAITAVCAYQIWRTLIGFTLGRWWPTHANAYLIGHGSAMNDTGIGLLGTGRYLQILDSIVIREYFLLWHPIWYWSDSSWRHPHDNRLDSCGAVIVSRRRQGEWGGGRVQAIHHHRHTVLRFTWYTVLCIFCITLHCYAIHATIGIGVGYLYFVSL